MSDILVMTKRNLMHYRRRPQLIVFATIQPIMFFLLMAFVFGGAVAGAGDYINYLAPGIFVQTVLFGSSQTTVGLAEDLTSGMVNRFRSLPMSRSALLMGRTLADSGRNLFALSLMIVVGHIFGFRFQDGFVHAGEAILLVLLFGFCFSWISATIGIALRDAEAAQAASFVWIFPLVFISSAFVPTSTMPKWLGVVADLSPVTAVINAARELVLGPGPAFEGGPPLADGSVLVALGWMLAILALFVPLAVRQYRRLE
jgi:ABC-2 type transport system permease protein/oleandomycin transport system permease protein